MPQAITEEKNRREEGAPPPPPPDPPQGNGGGSGPEDAHTPFTPAPAIGNAQLAMLFLILCELMFFAGLIGAFLVFRFGGQPWPPPFQPRLPVGITAVNTLFLLASSYTFIRARRSLRLGDAGRLCAYLTATGALGLIFLMVQGYEWIRLLNFGLTVSSGTYASTFYTIIGAHAAHVFGAILWLGVVLIRARLGHFSAQRSTSVTICGMYWHLVVGLWPVLFFLVYLM